MLEELFNAISDRIKANCTFVNSIAMYQSQDLFQQENLGYKPTVCFISFLNLNYEDLGGNYIQRCDLDVSIKIVVEERTKNYFKALQQKKQIVKALYNFSPFQFSFTRTSETLDTNPDSLYIFEVIFNTSFFEDVSLCEEIEIGGTSGIDWAFGLEVLSNGNDWSGTSGTNFINI